ncbi:C-C motif chemokine 19 [Tupaia chinensis]|uniref:C-C motif chemokine 19 n=1 Tax=Tupaia chinensis TaxID=246437 RepID=UPI0003C9097D|nr:C-C motif chemokine 19 [Tupaia chinensis]
MQSHSQTPRNLTRTPVCFPLLPAHSRKPQPRGDSWTHPDSGSRSLSVCLCAPSMAPCTAPLLALSLLVLWIFPAPAVGGANDAEDCCLSVTQLPIPGHIVRAFRYLLIKDGCRVPAVVFTTLRDRQLCAPLNQPWVNRIIRRLQKNSSKTKHHSS